MAHPTEPDFDDRLLGSAVRFLIDGQDEDAASVLITCKLEAESSDDVYVALDSSDMYIPLHVRLSGPRTAYDVLSDPKHPIRAAIRRAIEAVIPPGLFLKDFTARAEMIDIDPNWRNELLEIARGRGVNNQLADVNQARVRTWNNLRFRSQSLFQKG
jgi:hypothetical protein